MKNNQLVKRQQQTVALRNGARQLSLAVVKQMLNATGYGPLIQAVAEGAYSLAPNAANWLRNQAKAAQSSTFNPFSGSLLSTTSPMIVDSAPASTGVTVVGTTKFNGTIRFKHRELIDTLVGDDSKMATFVINPANSFAFPFLSTLARSYDKYKFHGLSFSVVSSSPSSNGGRWYLMWDPDSEDITGNTTQGFMASKYSLSSTAWQSGVLKAASSAEKYLAYNANDAVKDHGTVNFITRGTTATFDLYVEYDVSLIDANAVASSNFYASNSISPGTWLTNGALGNIGPPLVTSNGTGAIKLLAGFYDISITIRGVGLGSAGFDNSLENGTSKLLTGSTTHVFYRCVGSSPSTSVIKWTGTSTSIAAYTISVTPLSRSAYDLLVNNYA